MSFNDIKQSVDKLEYNIIAEVNDLRVTTEIALKELALYLNMSANDIEKIKENDIGFVKNLSDILDLVKILDSINKRSSEIPKEFIELNNTINSIAEESSDKYKKYHDINVSNLNSVYKYMQGENKNFMKILNEESNKIKSLKTDLSLVLNILEEYKAEMNRGQENLINVINTLITTSGQNVVSTNEVKKEELKETTKKIVSKNNLWIKIIGSVIGAGGVLSLIIQIIIKSMGK